MKTYHVEILSPVEIICESIAARSGEAAIEKAIRAAGFTGYHRCWYQGAPVDYPKGKRPVCPVYQDASGEFIHTIAWTN